MSLSKCYVAPYFYGDGRTLYRWCVTFTTNTKDCVKAAYLHFQQFRENRDTFCSDGVLIPLGYLFHPELAVWLEGFEADSENIMDLVSFARAYIKNSLGHKMSFAGIERLEGQKDKLLKHLKNNKALESYILDKPNFKNLPDEALRLDEYPANFYGTIFTPRPGLHPGSIRSCGSGVKLVNPVGLLNALVKFDTSSNWLQNAKNHSVDNNTLKRAYDEIIDTYGSWNDDNIYKFFQKKYYYDAAVADAIRSYLEAKHPAPALTENKMLELKSHEEELQEINAILMEKHAQREKLITKITDMRPKEPSFLIVSLTKRRASLPSSLDNSDIDEFKENNTKKRKST